MATISITVPDAVVGRVLAAVKGNFGNPPSGVTDAQWLRQQIAAWLQSIVGGYEANQAAQLQAQQTAQQIQVT